MPTLLLLALILVVFGLGTLLKVIGIAVMLVFTVPVALLALGIFFGIFLS